LQGWITLTNNSGVSYDNARTQLVAGDVQQGGGEGDAGYSTPIAGVRSAGVEQHSGPGEALGDYYLYTLPERTTIAENQTKQVSFLDALGVAAHKVYQFNLPEFVSADEPSNASVVVDFQNSTTGGLGAGLPAGVIRVYQRDQAGDPKFVGENQIGHTPQGSELAVKIGEAFDVTVQPTLVATESAGRLRTRFSMSYLIRNARSEPVTVELRQGGLYGRNTKVISESLPSRQIDAFTLGWSVPVPANGQTVVTSQVETGW
jgi:hypothetical protein